jgi:uncharacterized membrane protein YphA (DoxX/SURF4 family)
VIWAPTGWKTAVSHLAGFLVAILFIAAGVWKITDPFAAAARLAEAHVPASFSLIGASLLGVGETLAGVLILVPRFRRWGAWLAGAMLVAFIIYIGIFYNVLRGEDCNCFPWVRRAVGPAFFIGDAVMLALAAIAGRWARPSRGVRNAVLVLLAVVVFSAVSFGVSARIEASIDTPALIQVDSKPFPLRRGRVFLFFYNPECTHCDAAARTMAKLSWKDNVRIVTVATDQQRFAQEFLQMTGLRASICDDPSKLLSVYHIVTTPYAVALDNGRVKSKVINFDQPGLDATLRRTGFTR